MTPTFLSLCLFLLSSVAMAGDVSVATEAGGSASKPGKVATSGTAQEAETGTAGPAAAAPARASTPRSVPRWHSLLPGMIR